MTIKHVEGARLPAPSHDGRRRDLDGLRALAVLLVAVYHVWTDRVSGGVDVFLLLSGVFVGGSVLRESIGGTVHLRRRIVRSVRRLFPALVVVVAATLLAFVVFMPKPLWAETARQALASVLGVENWYLATAGRDYAAAGVTDSVFQHVWSLSVQTQFLVVVPVLYWFVARSLARRTQHDRRQVILFGTAALAAASFVYATAMTVIDQPWAYFDTAARAWEFLAGALIGLLMTGAGAPTARPRSMANGAGAAWLGWMGVAAVLATGFTVDGASEFPGPATLLPIGGAVAIVLAGGAPRGPAAMLGRGPLAVAGPYAYAFYLWHWPVLIVATALRDGRDAGWLMGVVILVVSAALAVATKHLAEDAFARERQEAGVRSRWAGAAVALATAVALIAPAGWLVRVEVERAAFEVAGSDIASHPGALAAAHPDLFSWDADAGLIPPLELVSEDKPRSIADGCWSVETEVVVCSYGDVASDRVITVAGGSHSEQWIDALALAGERSGFRVDTMIKWTCELIDGVDGVEFFSDVNPNCEQWSSNVLTELENTRPDAVITTWTRPSESGVAREVVPLAYERAWERLAAADLTTVALRDNPWTGADPVRCLSENAEEPEVCGIVASEVLDESAPEPVESPNWGIRVLPLDFTDVVCPDGWCPFAQGGRVVYRDAHHLTNTWAVSTASVWEERLLPLLGW